MSVVKEKEEGMTIPFQFGWSQVLLLLIGLVGLWLCITASLGLLNQAGFSVKTRKNATIEQVTCPDAVSK